MCSVAAFDCVCHFVMWNCTVSVWFADIVFINEFVSWCSAFDLFQCSDNCNSHPYMNGNNVRYVLWTYSCLIASNSSAIYIPPVNVTWQYFQLHLSVCLKLHFWRSGTPSEYLGEHRISRSQHLSVFDVWDLSFECVDLQTSVLVGRYISISRSRSNTKVTGSSSLVDNVKVVITCGFVRMA